MDSKAIVKRKRRERTIFSLPLINKWRVGASRFIRRNKVPLLGGTALIAIGAGFFLIPLPPEETLSFCGVSNKQQVFITGGSDKPTCSLPSLTGDSREIFEGAAILSIKTGEETLPFAIDPEGVIKTNIPIFPGEPLSEEHGAALVLAGMNPSLIPQKPIFSPGGVIKKAPNVMNSSGTLISLAHHYIIFLSSTEAILLYLPFGESLREGVIPIGEELGKPRIISLVGLSLDKESRTWVFTNPPSTSPLLKVMLSGGSS